MAVLTCILATGCGGAAQSDLPPGPRPSASALESQSAATATTTPPTATSDALTTSGYGLCRGLVKTSTSLLSVSAGTVRATPYTPVNGTIVASWGDDGASPRYYADLVVEEIKSSTLGGGSKTVTNIRFLDLATGAPSEVSLPGDHEILQTCYADHSVLLSNKGNKRVVTTLRFDDLRAQSSFELSRFEIPVGVFGDTLLTSIARTSLKAFDLATGETLWSAEDAYVRGGYPALPLMAARIDGRVGVVDVRTGEMLASNADNELRCSIICTYEDDARAQAISALDPVTETLWVGNDRTLRAFSLVSGADVTPTWLKNAKLKDFSLTGAFAGRISSYDGEADSETGELVGEADTWGISGLVIDGYTAYDPRSGIDAGTTWVYGPTDPVLMPNGISDGMTALSLGRELPYAPTPAS